MADVGGMSLENCWDVMGMYTFGQTTEDGYDYSIYDKSYNLLDGGVYDDPDISIHEAIELIIEDDPISGISALSDRQNATLIDYEELTAKADEAWQESIHSPLPEPPAEEHSYPLPDAGVSIADRNAYGYLNDEMLLLSQERATELFEQDLTVYMLFEDDTEAMAFDREDIDNHSGLFGIEKNDWTALQDYEDLKGDGRLSPEIQEQLFFESTKDAFAIYQLKSGEEYRDYRFEGLERLQNAGLEVTHENYDFIYTASIADFNGSINSTLNQLYEQFNINHPAGFTGHSLSVSDIIVLKIDDVVSSHYVDSFGFQELPQFLEPAYLVPDNFITGDRIDTPRGSFSLTSMTREQMAAAGYGYHHSSDDGKHHIMGNGTRAFAIKNEDSYLRTAEISTEQNFNKIDGILNNQPTVAELEETVKSGGTISLLDLGNAVHAEKREKRNSVVEQLKTKPLQEKEKSKKAPSMGAEMER